MSIPASAALLALCVTLLSVFVAAAGRLVRFTFGTLSMPLGGLDFKIFAFILAVAFWLAWRFDRLFAMDVAVVLVQEDS